MQVTADAVVPVTLQAVDIYGNNVTAYAGKVSFSSTDPLATLPTAYTFTGADAGSHTVGVGLHTASKTQASWSISVVDSKNLATLVTIPGFEVVNGAAAKFVLAFPSNITAGTPFSIKVSVVDAWGNGVKNYFGTIHFADTAGLAGQPPDYIFNGSDAGVHTFTATLSTTGNQTISVIDLSNPLLKASTVVSVNAPATSGGSSGGGGTGSGGGKGSA
jgi:hypothetical protein